MRGFTHYPALSRRQSDRGKSKSIEATCARRRHDCLHRLAVRAGLYASLLTLVGSTSYGQTLSVTPSSSAVFEGGTVQFTSNKPVNWSMATGSAGTLAVNSSTSATFTAPAEYLPNNVLAGCQTTPNDTVWNTRIDNLPVLTQVNGDTSQNSAAWNAKFDRVASGESAEILNVLAPDWGTNIATSSTPLVNEKFYYTDATATFPVPPLNVQKREGGTLVSPHAPGGASTDHRIQTVSRDYCQFYELYNNYFSPETCRDGTPGCTATAGLSFPWSSYTLPQNGSSAANLPYFPLTVHLSEIKKGVINHALAFNANTYKIDTKTISSYWPAYQTYGGCSITDCATAPPYGARFRLKASFPISSYSPEIQTVLTALKQYGMILTDATGGETASIYADADLTEDPSVLAAVKAFSNLKIDIGANFDVVDESSFEISPLSSEVNPANGYETPSSYSVVKATDQANPSSVVSVPVAVESNTPGVASPTLYVVAGTPGYPLASWFRSAHYPGVQWSLTSGVGSITANGIYTPPSSVTGPTAAQLKVASAQNANESENVYVTVLPASSDGAVRIDSGSLVATTDTETPPHSWVADEGFQSTGVVQTPLAYPRWTISNPDVLIYETELTSDSHDDIVYSFAIPNGNYKVRLMFGESNNHAPTNTFNPLYHAAMNLESNNQIGAHNYNFGTPIGYAYNTPIDAFIPAQVTDQNLYVAIRLNIPDSAVNEFPVGDGLPNNSLPQPAIDGLEIIPDTSAPHLVIDTQQQTSVAAGSTLQLYSVGWYMSNSVTWAVASGPGSIDQNGLYTAPDNAGSSPQTVTIRATSTTNGAIVATATLTIPAAS